MDRRLCFVLLLLAISCCCTAKDLAAKTESLEKQVQVSGNEDQCSVCKQSVSDLIATYSDKHKQAEMIDDLHNYCYRVAFDLAQMCISMGETYLNAIFKLVDSITPESMCKSIGLCEKVVSNSEYASNSSCDFCHRVVMEAIHQQLKNPDSQVEVLQLLLKACEYSDKNFSTKCKKLVFEYAPLVMVNVEQFLKTNDICTLLHVCDLPIHRMEESRHSAS